MQGIAPFCYQHGIQATGAFAMLLIYILHQTIEEEMGFGGATNQRTR